MSWLIDTSILVRTLDEQSPQQDLAIKALAHLRSQDETLYIVPQNLIEFWAVATRPRENNGLGLSVDDARFQPDQIKIHFILKHDDETVFENWERLVEQQGVHGKAVHDARIVAAMQTHSIANVLTFNIADFRRYSDIVRVSSPQDIV
jgi:predicted nucleic acid-binding protein